MPTWTSLAHITARRALANASIDPSPCGLDDPAAMGSGCALDDGVVPPQQVAPDMITESR